MTSVKFAFSEMLGIIAHANLQPESILSKTVAHLLSMKTTECKYGSAEACDRLEAEWSCCFPLHLTPVLAHSGLGKSTAVVDHHC